MKKFYMPLLLLLAITSCKEDKEDPVPLPEPEEQIKTVQFNFRFDPPLESIEKFELLVSQKDGKVLLDTLISTRTKHELQVKSVDTNFDITTIYKDPVYNWYRIKTYVQVNPDNWHIDETPINSGELEPAKISYSNAPSDNNTQFSSLRSHSYSSSSLGGPRVFSFDRLIPNDLTYLLLPSVGRYIFTEVTSTETYVDFSKASTAVKHKFNKPIGVTNTATYLIGYTKAGDYSNPIRLFSGPSYSEDFDLQYPPTVIEEFGFTLSYIDTEGYTHYYSTTGLTIPIEMPFITKSDFTVTKANINDFQIKFGEDKPITYTMEWLYRGSDFNTEWEIFLSPEQVTYNLQDFIKKLNPKYLEGKDMTKITLSRILTRKVEGHTHQSMHDYLNTPEADQRNSLKQSRQIFKYFR